MEAQMRRGLNELRPVEFDDDFEEDTLSGLREKLSRKGRALWEEAVKSWNKSGGKSVAKFIPSPISYVTTEAEGKRERAAARKALPSPTKETGEKPANGEIL
ncbi:hypothetical protein CRG98_006469 [Punica granatum]|uniref:Uncharacterized protein n=1 Tax=Punica granatum TaxID=22663 RepID=A0A2I0KXD7_PUNGR|nr:hypothetical protein CRG98_006469 [Punica granatum]